MNAITFGSLLHDLRSERSLSQRELAKRANIDFTYISKLENGKNECLSVPVLESIIVAMGIPEHRDELYRLAGLIPQDIREILCGSRYALELVRAISGLSDVEVKQIMQTAIDMRLTPNPTPSERQKRGLNCV